jgi:glutamate formiminotransferase
LRRGGPDELQRRLADGELEPDFGPARLHRSAGATLVGARPPLVAFNLLLERGVTLDEAQAVAATIREGGAAGLPGVRAIGLWLTQRGAAQVSCNVEDPAAVPLRDVVEAVRARVPVAAGELVGLAPRAALEGFPADVPIGGFDPERHLLENLLGL